MTELEKYRSEERKRLIYGVRRAISGDNDIPLSGKEEEGFTWRKGFAPGAQSGEGTPSSSTQHTDVATTGGSRSAKSKKRSWIDKLIISENSKMKATLDIYINLLVAYSCFTTIYFVSFDD